MSAGAACYGWGGGYLCAALVAAAIASVYADAHRRPNAPGAERQWAVILLAAALWPVMIVGLAQLGVFAVVVSRRARSQQLAEHAR